MTEQNMLMPESSGTGRTELPGPGQAGIVREVLLLAEERLGAVRRSYDETDPDSYVTRMEGHEQILFLVRFVKELKQVAATGHVDLREFIVDYGYDAEDAASDASCGLEYEPAHERAAELYNLHLEGIQPWLDKLNSAGIEVFTGVEFDDPPEYEPDVSEADWLNERKDLAAALEQVAARRPQLSTDPGDGTRLNRVVVAAYAQAQEAGASRFLYATASVPVPTYAISDEAPTGINDSYFEFRGLKVFEYEAKNGLKISGIQFGASALEHRLPEAGVKRSLFSVLAEKVRGLQVKARAPAEASSAIVQPRGVEQSTRAEVLSTAAARPAAPTMRPRR